MEPHINLTAYNGVEELKRFSKAEFHQYCQAKLNSCEGYVKFIGENCGPALPDWQGKVCEIGSGNSKLLYGLERAGLLQQGVGFELSPTRHRFAERFKAWIQSRQVVNCNQDVLNTAWLDRYDLIIGVDLVFQLIEPVAPENERKLLRWIWNSLRPNGYLLLQLMDLSRILQMIRIQDGVYYWWERFPEYDPWELVLVEFSLDERKDLVWDKTFLKRGSQERSHFVNILRNYPPRVMLKLLEQHGFAARLFGEASGIGLEQDEYIILAQKLP